jgi:hypothetical protein
MFVDIGIYPNSENFKKNTEYLLGNSAVEIGNGIIKAIQLRLSHFGNNEFDPYQDKECRYGINDDAHVLVTGYQIKVTKKLKD